MKNPFGTSEFSKNIITLVGGTGLAQALTLAASPILSRLFTPEEFAPYQLFTAIVGIISVVAAGRFELAILLPKKEEEAKSIVALSFILSLFTALITLVGVILYDVWLYQYWPTGTFNAWFYLLPPAIFIMGAYKAVNFWSTRHKTFWRNSLGRIITTLLLAGLSILFGLFDYIPGLIIAFVVGNLAGLIALSTEIIGKTKSFFQGVSIASIKAMFKTHAEFAKVNVPHALVDNLQEYGIIFFILYFFTEALVGLYGFAFRILKAPLTLIGSAYYQVFYQKVTQGNFTAKETKKMILNVFRNTFLIGIIPFTILFFYAPEIFAFVFGEEWREAGVISQILTPWLFLNFMLSPVSCVPLIYNRQRGAFMLTLVDVVFKYTLLIIGGLSNDYYLSFTLLSIFASCLMIFGMWWYLSIPVDKKIEHESPL